MRQKILLLFAIFLYSLNAVSGVVDTLKIYSPEMDKEIHSVVVLPDDYKTGDKAYPVLYLLHGYSGDHLSWISLVPQLKNYVDEFDMIVVAPDGGYDSWYMDSPVNDKSCYETFMTSTLIQTVDEQYKTIANREHRGIAGLSMGGHGALFLAIRHRDLFGAAGSMSGGVDLRPFPDNWNLKKILGNKSSHPENWEKYSVINAVSQLKNKELKLFIDIGIDDFFLEVNRNLHDKLQKLKIDHDYVERPGGHTWDYWRNALPYHMLFFRAFFNQKD